MSPFLDVLATRNQSRLNERVHIVGACAVCNVIRCWFSWVSSEISVTYLFIPLKIITRERVPSSKKGVGHDLELLPPKLYRSSCSHGSILLLWMLRCLEVKCTLSHEPPNLSSSASSRVVKYCPFATVYEIPALEQGLRIFVHNRAASFLAQSYCSNAFCSLSTILLTSPWSPNCSEQQVSLYFSEKQRVSRPVAYVRYCSVDTELIDGKDCAKIHFGCIVVTTEMHRQFSISFSFQSSSFPSTGSTEYGVSTFTEVEHHVLSDTIPFSIGLYV